jgi:hypothetical protein
LTGNLADKPTSDNSDTLPEGHVAETHTMEGNRSNRRERGCFWRHTRRNAGTEVCRDTDDLGVICVSDTCTTDETPDSEPSRFRADLDYVTCGAVTDSRLFGELPMYCLTSALDPFTTHMFNDRPHEIRTLARALDQSFLGPGNARALGAGTDHGVLVPNEDRARWALWCRNAPNNRKSGSSLKNLFHAPVSDNGLRFIENPS